MKDTLLTLCVFICTALLSEGLPGDQLQKQEAIHNEHNETTNLNAQKDALNGNSSLETVSPHGLSTNLGLSDEMFCKLCVCDAPFDDRCLVRCCGKKMSPPETVRSRETVASPALNPSTTTKDADRQVQHNDTSHLETKSKTTNEHHDGDAVKEVREDHHLIVVDSHPASSMPTHPKATIETERDAEPRLESQHPETGKPETESDRSLHPIYNLKANSVKIANHGSGSANHSTNVWIVATVLSSAVMIGAFFILMKKWKHRTLREAFLIRRGSGYSEIRPSCLRDVLDDHSD
ncbi:uncharacterized protein LOC111044730 [Nilaparvata lugens]|uniref:uncharacterized protein LOC111044730 n=1 Tax=Nilaparvata lugens TaxID=108931 RepID=UPI00193CBE21|nr:uncharacterized protein LOC111044730 [Nilaparvata lugens]XP_022185636.2 uncharacterized protein LOC111044730 [Nilaparvata lugens]